MNFIPKFWQNYKLMFPAFALPSFSDNTSQELFNDDNKSNLENNIAGSYSFGLYSQLSELLHLSKMIFQDILDEFSIIENKFGAIKSHLKSFQSTASKTIDENLQTEPEEFLKDECNNITGSEKDKNILNISLKNRIIDYSMSKANDQQQISLELWKDVIENYEEFEHTVSDPSVFQDMLYAEMEKQYSEEYKKKMQKKQVKQKKDDTSKPLSHLIAIKTKNPTTHSQFLSHPPPRGQTDNWRNQNQNIEKVSSEQEITPEENTKRNPLPPSEVLNNDKFKENKRHLRKVEQSKQILNSDNSNVNLSLNDFEKLASNISEIRDYLNVDESSDDDDEQNLSSSSSF